MQGIVFARSLRAIVEQLELPQLLASLEPVMEGQGGGGISEDVKSKFSTSAFQTNAALRMSTWSAAQREILDKLEIAQYLNESNLSRLMVKMTQSGAATQIRTSEAFANFYHSLLSVMWVAASTTELLEQERIPDVSEDEELLEVVIADYGEGPVTAIRLRHVLEAMESVNDKMARLVQVEGRPLRIAVADSGSEIILILIGSALVVSSIRAVYSEVVNRVRFRPNEIVERNLETLAAGLDSLARIEESSSDETIDDESARLLKHGVLKEITSLLGLGVLPNEIDEPGLKSTEEFLLEHRKRQLLKSGTDAAGEDEQEE